MKSWQTSWVLALFLSLCLSSLSGCGLFGKDYTVVGAKPCPVMTYEAMGEYDKYGPDMPTFRVWVGQMILYCEEQEARGE